MAAMDLTLPLDNAAIEKILLHRYPFLFVDRITELESELRPRRAANTLPFCMAYQGMPFAFLFAARDDRVVPIKERRRSSGTSSLGLRAALGRELSR